MNREWLQRRPKNSKSSEGDEVWHFDFRQRATAVFSRLVGLRGKRLLAGVIAAGFTSLAITPPAEAHWWQRCYSSPHFAVPYYCGWRHCGWSHCGWSHCGWRHCGFSSYPFPSYAHWYTFGNVCYRPIAYYQVSYRPVPYRPVFPRAFAHHALLHNKLELHRRVGLHGNAGWAAHTAWLGNEQGTVWDTDGISHDGWDSESEMNLEATDQNHSWGGEIPGNGRQHSVAKPKAELEGDDLTWEEAIYGPVLSGLPVRLVSFENSDDENAGAAMEHDADPATTYLVLGSSDPLSKQSVAKALSAESILVDEMVRTGNSVEAFESLQEFVSNNPGFDSSLQLRYAALSLFASTKPIAIEVVLDRFNSACAAGNGLDETGLGPKISDYFAPSRIDVSNTLNEFSKLALRSEEPNVSQLLIVATLLRLDGEKSRSRIFAQAAFDQAAETGSLQWNSLMTALLQ